MEEWLWGARACEGRLRPVFSGSRPVAIGRKGLGMDSAGTPFNRPYGMGSQSFVQLWLLHPVTCGGLYCSVAASGYIVVVD